MEEIDAAHAEFRRIGALNRYDYVIHYLKVRRGKIILCSDSVPMVQ